MDYYDDDTASQKTGLGQITQKLNVACLASNLPSSADFCKILGSLEIGEEDVGPDSSEEYGQDDAENVPRGVR